MSGLDKNDLKQMNLRYFQSLSQEKLVEVADNLHILAMEQWSKINSNSSNSSKPPSLDNPFQNQKSASVSKLSASKEKLNEQNSDKKGKTKDAKPKRKPGRQKGAKGFGRTQILKASVIIPHYPNQCSACRQNLSTRETKPYMGHQVLELEATELKLKVVCQLHHYYQSTCSCGHQSQSKPGVGISSNQENRTRDLQLTEYVLVGANLASFIASLGVRYRLSRIKIREFLFDWLGIELSVGTPFPVAN